MQTVDETGEETPATGENDVAHEDLPDLRVACAEGTTDQGRDGFGQVGVGCLVSNRALDMLIKA